MAKRKKEVEGEEPVSTYWIVTAKRGDETVRQVYPNDVEAKRYADSLRKRKEFKDIKVEAGKPR